MKCKNCNRRSFKKISAILKGIYDWRIVDLFSLRSGFISHALKKGIPIHQIRDLVGHENIATTNIYSITTIDESIKSYEELF